jgi:hypothetical protein
VGQKYQRMETASNVLGYVPWIGAAVAFAVSGSLLVSLAGLTLLALVISVPAIVLGHIVRYKIRKNEGPSINPRLARSGLILGYLGLFAAVNFFVWFPYSDPLHGRGANEASAVGSLRSIQRAADAYKSNHPALGFPEKLAELSAASGEAGTDGAIDPHIANGEKSGYRFRYVAKRNAEGLIESYEAFADPTHEGMTGMRHFFVNPSGIRCAVKGPASAQSPILQ